MADPEDAVTTITVRVRVEGFHCWPGAIPEAEWLAARHRHLFHVEVESVVQHDDRDREFILFGREIRALLRERFGSPCEFGSLSCEQIAGLLLSHFDALRVSVFEDGENGATVYA